MAEPLSLTPKPNRRVAALATLAFASAVTGGTASTAAATSASQRGKALAQRTAARPVTATPHRALATDPRPQLPGELDVDGLAAELGVHPGRLAAALRGLTPDETRSIGGLDPLTALAHTLDLPPTDVYLAAARFAARGASGQ